MLWYLLLIKCSYLLPPWPSRCWGSTRSCGCLELYLQPKGQMTHGYAWKWQFPSFLVNFVKKSFPLIASLVFQMMGFYKELWLSGAVTPARGSDDPRLCFKMTTLFIMGNFCWKVFPIYCIPGPPDVGVLQGAVAVWSCNSSQKVRWPKAIFDNENSLHAW